MADTVVAATRSMLPECDPTDGTQTPKPRSGGPEYLLAVYRLLTQAYGTQHWWPAESPFEVMVGAILTQNTSWSAVETALQRLRALIALEADEILNLPLHQLTEALRPVGYFNVKAARLLAFCRFYLDQGGYLGLASHPTEDLRRQLLAVHGIGPETADDILLYAFARPVFVVDAYTRRLGERLGFLTKEASYRQIQGVFEAALPRETALFNEYHALIVRHAKETCRPRPRCAGCCLQGLCPAASQSL